MYNNVVEGLNAKMWGRLRRLVGMERFVGLGGYGEANVEEEVQILV